MYSLKLIFVALAAFAATCTGSAISTTEARCPERRVLETKMVGKVNLTTFECAGQTAIDLKASSESSLTKRTPNAGFELNLPRQFQNCAGGASDTQCQCQILCNQGFCTGGRAQAPRQADCQAIDNEFASMAGSFFVPSGQGVSATVGSCQAVWINESTGTLEYCFENFGQLAAVTYTNCVTVQGGGQGGCIANNFLWFFEFLIPGNTILVP